MTDAARTSAQRLALDHELMPDADWSRLLAVAREFADYHDLPLPGDVEGVAIRPLRGDQRPVIVLDTAKPYGCERRRFTLAHELGHLRLPWHLTVRGCTPKEQVEHYVASLADEAEANAFAAELLVPKFFLEEAEWDHGNGHDFFAEVYRAKASPIVVSLQLAHYLPSGWSFVELGGSRVRYSGRSEGTHTNIPFRGETFSTVGLDKLCDDVVRIRLRNGYVGIWMYVDSTGSRVAAPDGDSRTVLASILADLPEGDQDPEKLRTTVSAITGSIHNRVKDLSAATPASVESILLARFTSRPELADVVEHPDFRLYLQLRAAELLVGWRAKAARGR